MKTDVTISKAILAFCVMLMVAGVVSIAAILFFDVPVDGDVIPSEPVVLVSLILSSVLGLMAAIALAVRWSGWSFLRLGPISLEHVSMAIILVPIALGFSFLWSMLLEAVSAPIDPQLFVQGVIETDDFPTLCFAVFYAVIGAPILEEALFRGFMLPVMINRLGRWLGIGLNSFLFGIIHAADPWAILPAMFIGLSASWLRDRSGSLGAGMAFHSLNNLCALLVLGAGY